jgi:hypothetical protein
MAELIDDLEAVFEEVLGALRESRNGLLRRYALVMPPEVVWDPAPDSVPVPALRAALENWNALRGDRALPDWREFHVEDFGSLAANATVVDPIPGTRDLRYRIFGSQLAETVGQDWEGSTAIEICEARRTLGPLLCRAVFLIARERRKCVYTFHSDDYRGRPHAVHRVVFPFAVAEPHGVRFVAAIAAEASALGQATAVDIAPAVRALHH